MKHIWKVTFKYNYLTGVVPKTVLLTTRKNHIGEATAKVENYLRSRAVDFPGSSIVKVKYLGTLI